MVVFWEEVEHVDGDSHEVRLSPLIEVELPRGLKLSPTM